MKELEQRTFKDPYSGETIKLYTDAPQSTIDALPVGDIDELFLVLKRFGYIVMEPHTFIHCLN